MFVDMVAWFKKTLFKVVLKLSNKFSSDPDQQRVYGELSDLYECITKGKKSKGPVINFGPKDRFIIFSDQHKGARNGADDFMLCEPNYLAALDYYYNKNFFYIALGDSEELWENKLSDVKKNQQATFSREKNYLNRNSFIKIYGNHDLYWNNDPLAFLQLKDIYGTAIPIYEGVVLRTTINQTTLDIFCTHGHQGDKVSDGNWFSKFFVSKVWAPIQAFTKINPNTPAYDAQLKTLHNRMMYQWSSQQKKLLLITGHTHQPVFESLTHIEREYRRLMEAEKANNKEQVKQLEETITKLKFEYTNITTDYLSLKPTYFNSGCCCFNDGDITGIEIDEGCIRLVKWHTIGTGHERIVLEESSLEGVYQEIKN
jgi:predicted phosphodiesterase